jgi:cytochrome c-type biogenesis protein CcmH/NrfG
VTGRRTIETRRDQALADLADVERQQAEGELDEQTAAELMATYRREIDAAEEALAGIDETEDEVAQHRTGRSPVRVAIGAVGLLAGFAVAIFAVTQAVEPRAEGGFVTGGQPEPARNLDDVSNAELEVVVAENPEIVPMRLALARRYVEDGDFSQALDHYMTVLEDGPHPEALAYVGWMTYLSGEPETAETFLVRSLEEDPTFELAMWFLANVRVDGLDDPNGALPLLDELEASDLPDDLATAVADLRARAEEASS